MKYRKKPVVVEATQFLEPKLAPLGVFVDANEFWADEFWVVTIHGQKTPVYLGDWIITEPDGVHHYPCKPGIFAATYEPVEEKP